MTELVVCPHESLLCDFMMSQAAGACCDISVVTTADNKQHQGHRVMLAAVSPVFASNPTADIVLLHGWSTNDYGVFLDLAYSGISSHLSLSETSNCRLLLKSLGAKKATITDQIGGGEQEFLVGETGEESTWQEPYQEESVTLLPSASGDHLPTKHPASEKQKTSVETCKLSKCPYCKQFRTTSNLSRHVHESHQRKNELSRCHRMKKNELKIALKVFRCTSPCKASFGRKDHLSAHKTSIKCKLNRQFKCQFCGGDFHSQNTLELHIDNRSCPKQFSCIVCSKFFSNVKCLYNHTKEQECVMEVC